MTVEQVYKAGVSLLPEKIADNPELEDYAVDWVNIMLQETLWVENSVRRFNNEEELLEAPTLATKNDEIPYCDNLVRVAFPYGIASHAFVDDDNDYRANLYRTQYQVRANEAQKYTKQIVKDMY